ncbi:helix-turn-helix domain-containing protein [Muricauda oceani]|uniref:AraC family transcriptional regulator n=1 Tax=Flagellimonas oceani TaxID=2698672 RepID=A0A6G7J5N6_9FLAO|nr:helix-turn-helix domain-containing protein [Allomuricauda oceani]MBW8244446.1 helix-turn-helix domain-containing protein [Allomuricauda oceani]QII45898.1 AraC family transcriptional regulator [Allomuricauda oceani]
MSRKEYAKSSLNKKDKYEKTGLSEAFSLELKNKLEHLMNEEKLYLDHELRLDNIAELLGISRHHASQVINENFNLSFYDFVNSYRIEEAKNRLCSDFESSPESISDIAYQCGFNNRVSFYKAFKKITHITPKEFIQSAA